MLNFKNVTNILDVDNSPITNSYSSPYSSELTIINRCVCNKFWSPYCIAVHRHLDPWTFLRYSN